MLYLDNFLFSLLLLLLESTLLSLNATAINVKLSNNLVDKLALSLTLIGRKIIDFGSYQVRSRKL